MDSRSALMAASVRNHVWAAPGQDAQFLCKTDGLKGEDHGRALCHTGDVIPGTSSLHDCDLVRECFFCCCCCYCFACVSEHHSVFFGILCRFYVCVRLFLFEDLRLIYWEQAYVLGCYNIHRPST